MLKLVENGRVFPLCNGYIFDTLRLLVNLSNSSKCRKSAVGYNGLPKRLEIAER